jgi:hypothetical protein
MFIEIVSGQRGIDRAEDVERLRAAVQPAAPAETV